jgi:hypothetical protein
MELAYGRPLFDTYGRYESDPAQIIAMLEDTVTQMQDRAAQLAGHHRDHIPTTADPFTVVIVDEVAFLTAYQPDRKLRERALAAIATLTTQGRAVGYCVVGALQDPRKDVLTIRNLFPDRIAMRLDEPEQVDMVLGDGVGVIAGTKDASRCIGYLTKYLTKQLGHCHGVGKLGPPPRRHPQHSPGAAPSRSARPLQARSG